MLSEALLVLMGFLAGATVALLFFERDYATEYKGLCQVTASLVRMYGSGDVMHAPYLDKRYALRWGTDGKRVYAEIEE